jgi:hypothetical protein
MPTSAAPLNFNWPAPFMNPMAFAGMGPLGSLLTSQGHPIGTPPSSSPLTAAQLQAASAAAVFAPLFSLQQPANPLHANLPMDLQLRKRGRPPGSGKKQGSGEGMMASTSAAGPSLQGEGGGMLSDGPLGQLLMPTSMEGQPFYGGEGEEGVARFKVSGCLLYSGKGSRLPMRVRWSLSNCSHGLSFTSQCIARGTYCLYTLDCV